MRKGGLLLGAVAVAALVGCGRPSAVQPQARAVAPQAQAARVAIAQVDVATAWRDLQANNGPLTLLDVRNPDEFAAGRAPGALLKPLPQLDQWAPGLAPRKMHYLVICRSGSRSMQACQRLVDLGFAHVTNVQGGMLAWEKAGLPIQR